ncbi:MAG: hypothetical protein ACRC46_00005, partial [Thermoguttaceae bacterium]
VSLVRKNEATRLHKEKTSGNTKGSPNRVGIMTKKRSAVKGNFCRNYTPPTNTPQFTQTSHSGP